MNAADRGFLYVDLPTDQQMTHGVRPRRCHFASDLSETAGAIGTSWKIPFGPFARSGMIRISQGGKYMIATALPRTTRHVPNWCRHAPRVALFIASSLLPAFSGAIPASAGPAIGQFEIKDLEAEPGRVEFQSQNAHSFGQPSRKSRFDPGEGERVYDDNSVVQQRHALELEAAFTRYLRMRMGVEFEKERIEEPVNPGMANDFEALRFDEVALEGVVILVPVPESGGVGLGLLAEFEAPAFSDELNSIIFGPIIEAKAGAWNFIANITFVHSFGSGGAEALEEGERDRKWDLAYALQLAREIDANWTLALEAYGTFDRLGNSGTPGIERAFFGDHDLHRAGPIVYYKYEADGGAAAEDDEGGEGDEEGTVVSIGTGVLFGLNDNTPDATLKWSVEVEF